jgi:RNA polymerase sigma-70 factor (ECF subfamily)
MSDSENQIKLPPQPVVFMDEEKDAHAVKKCLDGQIEAFGEIIDRYQKTVLNLAYRIVNNYEDAKDVAQTVFVKAYGNLVSYDPRYKFFSWLYRIGVNESLNYVNHRKRHMTPYENMVANPPDPQDKLVSTELEEKIRQTLMSLNPRQRALIAMSLDGFSYKEIGRMLDLPEKKVKSKLFSTRHKIRTILKNEGFGIHG